MKLIIDIDEELYKDIINRNPDIETEVVLDRLVDGVDNVTSLEDIKAEIEEQKSLWDSTPKNGHYRAFSTCIDILDEYISELKGGNK